ncbi:MAG: slipin family protein [Planctomycetales bacterium]|nr:slipin family protein [Planctomycetales bacterium]
MWFFKRVRVRSFEFGLLMRDGEFQKLLAPGSHWLFDPFQRLQVQRLSQREARVTHDQLDLIVKSGQLAERAEVVDLKDDQRALVWIDGRLSHLLGPGLHAFWTGQHEVRVELIEVRGARFEHAQLNAITRLPTAKLLLDVCAIDRDKTGVLFVDGRCQGTVGPGVYAFWKGQGDARLVEVDLRQTTLDIGGQEIMTADKVSLRLNALVVFRIVDAAKAVSTTDDFRQSLYREAQLALRAIVGVRELDAFLTSKDEVAEELVAALRVRAGSWGLEVVTLGIRDVILPGEMKDLMNRVTEAKKAAEANLIARREETAAMRSQANTARLLADNPTLMRLRELEVLEKIATSGKLQVVLGEKGLADRVVNLL